MEGAQGAVLRVKLRYLDAWTDARRRHAAHYEELLADANVQTPKELPYARHVFHVYALRLAERDRLQLALQEKEIQTAIHYPIPVHLQKAYRDFGYGVGGPSGNGTSGRRAPFGTYVSRHERQSNRASMQRRA